MYVEIEMYVDQWVSTRGDFFPDGTFGSVWGHFWFSSFRAKGRADGSVWHLVVEGRDAAKHLPAH